MRGRTPGPGVVVEHRKGPHIDNEWRDARFCASLSRNKTMKTSLR